MSYETAGITPNSKIEQRVILKYLVKLKKSFIECLKMSTEVYGKDTMSFTRVFQWHKKFKNGRDDFTAVLLSSVLD